MSPQYYSQSSLSVIDALQTNKVSGLTSKEAKYRLGEYGLNKLPAAKVDSIAVIFLRQFQSPLIYILFIASLIVFWLGEIIDGSIILFVLFFNAIIGAIQEGKAQNTLQALKQFIQTKALVLRDGKEIIIPDTELVPGDIIILQEGEKVPADARIILTHNLKIDEAALTGESKPVGKIEEPLLHQKHSARKHYKSAIKNISNDADSLELSIAEQKNMVFKGTHIVAGNGKAVITATANKTVIGKISQSIAISQTEIPLKTNIRYFSKLIIIITLSISGVVFFLGLFLGNPIREMFTIVVSLAVSVIPEGLPIVMTVVLATGVWRMSKHNALVKKLQAVEALGQAKVIAVDKTGTITKNEMMAEQVYTDGKIFVISGSGYDPQGEITLNQNIIDPLNHPEILKVGKMLAWSANARVLFSEENSDWNVFGDPTEAAMLVLAEKIGFHKDDLERESPKIADIPFDYKTKYHLTVHQVNRENILTAVGAPEVILAASKKMWTSESKTEATESGRIATLSKEDKKKLEAIFVKMSKQGLRVIALAESRAVDENINLSKIKNLAFVGFLGMKDALRPEARQSIEQAASAGMRVVMITGDHKNTAQAVALGAGIYHQGDEILTGQDIDLLSDSQLAKKLNQVSVFARVSPDHKLRIINGYRQRGEIIAMTGDGVNDAPSLVAADLGLAMGKIGTDVAKEASDIVLLDDNFASIIFAIEEGRNIYKTIKKVILYLFSTNMGEVLTIIAALVLGLPLPILAAQIIWLNLVTDSFLDVALAMEPKEEGLIVGAFEKPKKYLIDSLMVQRIIFMSIPMMIGTVYLFWRYLPIDWSINPAVDLTKAWTIALTSLAVFQWFNVWNCRSESKSIFKMNPVNNKFLIGATFIVIALHLLAVYNPFMQKILHTTALTFSEWLIIIPISCSVILVEEVRKFITRKITDAKRIKSETYNS